MDIRLERRPAMGTRKPKGIQEKRYIPPIKLFFFFRLKSPIKYFKKFRLIE